MKTRQGENLVKLSDGIFHYDWLTLSDGDSVSDNSEKVSTDDSKANVTTNGEVKTETVFKAPDPPSREEGLKQYGEGGEVVVVFFHGAGQSSLTWRPLFTSLSIKSKVLPQAALLAFDARGHGKTKTKNETDMSIEALTADALEFIQSTVVVGSSILLVGHSMGGAVATHVATKLHTINRQFKLRGLMLIDIVEGSALDAMENSKGMVKGRPQRFDSTKSAIEWSFQQKMIRNRDSAAVTVPGQLLCLDDGTYVWRTDLVSTFSHWEGWFKGLSEKFLSLPISGKLLLIGGWNRLDTALTRGQMQGKFKLVMTPQDLGGHFIQEDSPDYVAEIFSNFLLRNAPKTIEEQKKGNVGFSAKEILALRSKSKR